MVTCPHCNGRGYTEGFACPGGYRQFPCENCGTTGQVADEYIAQYEQAKKIRAERRERHATIREEALRLGCSLSEVADIEHGRTPKTDAGHAAWAKRLEEIGASV